MTKAIVPLAEGVEEMEAVILIDVMRRAKWEVVVAGMADGPVRASRRVVILPDRTWAETDPTGFDLMVLPGGSAGARTLAKDERILKAVRHFVETERIVAAVCAGPLSFFRAGVLTGRRFTCHPDVAPDITEGTWVNEPVVVDGPVITSQGAGTCFLLGLALIEKFDGSEKAAEVARGMLWPPPSGTVKS